MASKTPKPTLATIVQVVSAHFDIEPERLYERTREQPVAQARQIVMYLAYELGHISRSSLAEDFDRTWAAVHRAIQSIAQILLRDTQARRELLKLAETVVQKAYTQYHALQPISTDSYE